MSGYTKIIVGLDLTDESSMVIERAIEIGKLSNAQLYLTHCIEPLSFSYGGDLPLDLTGMQTTLHDQATERLKALATQYGLDPEHIAVPIGQPDREMHQLVTELSAQLIVVGSHGRHGLSLLLGSTSNAVIQGATCDVLAVRL